jgi:hypothetical protein
VSSRAIFQLCRFSAANCSVREAPSNQLHRINIQCKPDFNLDTKYHIRIALFQFFSHLPTLSVLPSELLNPNRASLQAGRENPQLSTYAKSFKKLTMLQRKDRMRNYALKVSCSLAKNYLAVERTSKSGAVRADGETPHASASGPDSYTRRVGG